MAADNGQMSFRRGVMSLVILGLLKKEDMYGYQLVQETERRSGGRIVTQEVLVGRRMTRVYYHLEPAGEQRLEELVREYEEVTKGVFQIIEGDGQQLEKGTEQPEDIFGMSKAGFLALGS